MFTLKKYSFILIGIITLLLYGVFVVFADAPNGGYAPGDTLNPSCAPGDTDCIVSIPVGASYGDTMTSGHNNEVLYLDSSGALASDSNFTRITSTGITNILRSFDSVATGQYTFQTGTLYNMSITSGAFTDGETITDTTSGATATLVNYGSAVDVYILSNISGSFDNSDTVVGDNSGATADINGGGIPTSTSTPQAVIVFDVDTGSPIGSGTIIGTISGGYSFHLDTGTITDGAVILDDINSPSFVIGVTSLSSLPSTTAVTTGYQSFGNIAGIGLQGSAISQSNGTDTIYNGVFDTTSFNGSPLSAGILLLKQDGSTSNFIAGAGSINGEVKDTNGYGSTLYLTSSGFNLKIDNGNGEVGFNSDGHDLKWYYGSTEFIFPSSYGSSGQVLTDNGNGSLYWSTPSGGSSLIGSTSTYGDETWLGAGAGANNASSSATVFIGVSAGYGATNAYYSNFIGRLAGQGATNANYSNFMGPQAGLDATDAIDANFFGHDAGNGATGARNSNFIGSNAGYGATGAQYSNFFGLSAGDGATGATNSNFFGTSSGQNATGAYESNFIGVGSGSLASNAYHASFIGAQAGNGATNAFNSNFFGNNAGNNAVNASNSIFIGTDAGSNDTVDNTSGGWNILIGSGTNTGGFTGSIALGENALNTASNQFTLADSIVQARLGGIEYAFPTAQALNAGDILTNDGFGNLSWAAATGGNSIPLSYMAANNGVATLDANGKIPSSQLATLAINNSFVVGSEPDMLALNAHTGDIAVRTDNSTTYVLSIEPATDINNWVQLLWNPVVSSVNGMNGTVSLTTDDIGEGTTNFYFTNTRVNNAITAYLPSQSGNNGKFLTTDGSGTLTWAAVNSGTTLPSQSGNAGRVLSTDGAGNLTWITQSGGSGSGTGPIYSNAANSLFSSDIGAGEGDTGLGNNIFLGFSAGNGANLAHESNFLGNSAGQNATNASSSNFFGVNSGSQATNASQSNFFGQGAGTNATNASQSNFFGQQSGAEASSANDANFFGFRSGQNATNAAYSNFFGNNAGSSATNAFSSNFFGSSAGEAATYASFSNFIGVSAGQIATNASYSNFIGNGSGQAATNADKSNFFGILAGYGATDAHDANFMGDQAGYQAANAEYSNFFGDHAGYQATDAANASFFGDHAGYGAQNASGSNFFGLNAGYSATSASNSNFLGANAGYSATNASQSNFFGNYAGQAASSAIHSNFFGFSAGLSATNASYSNFLGHLAGYEATNANNSNFFGDHAGYGATEAYESIFIGNSAGRDATDAFGSNFFGTDSGNSATNASFANFFGLGAGQNATNASQSNFFGLNAGKNATSADIANFIGMNAGLSATNANNSTFIGQNAGNGATNAAYSYFLGKQAGKDATNATYSTFIGDNVGVNATNAANSIFIGNYAGLLDSVDNRTSGSSILIGNSTNTNGFSNSIALGTSAINTNSNEFMIGSTISPINSTRINGSSSTQCTITTGTGIACTSDERLKTNIVDLTDDTLTKLLNVKTVTYNWLQNSSSPIQIGFLAQDLEQYFPELVATDSTGYKSVYYAQMTPILVESIRELNLKVTNLQNLTPGSTETATFFASLVTWLGDTGNGIQKIFAREVHTDTLCVGQTCVTEAQLQMLLQNSPTQIQTPTPPVSNPDDTPSVDPESSGDNPSSDPDNTPSGDSDNPPPTSDPGV